MKVLSLFSQNIGYFKYNENLSGLKDEIYKIKQSYPNSVTNYPKELCYQTPMNLFDLSPNFLPLKDFLTTSLKKFFDKNLLITESWGNIYSKYGNSSLHTHNSNISGVLYLQVPPQNDLYIYNKFKFTYKTISPIKGDIYFFEGDQPHETSINLFDQEKVVISFNLNFIR